MALEDVRDTISTAWEALTPPTDTDVGYHEIDDPSVLDGDESRRGFYHGPAGGPILVSRGSTLVFDWEWTVTLVLSLLGLTFRTTFDAVVAEGRLFAIAVHDTEDWPDGTEEVLVDSVRPALAEEEDRILVLLVLRARVAEE